MLRDPSTLRTHPLPPRFLPPAKLLRLNVGLFFSKMTDYHTPSFRNGGALSTHRNRYTDSLDIMPFVTDSTLLRGPAERLQVHMLATTALFFFFKKGGKKNTARDYDRIQSFLLHKQELCTQGACSVKCCHRYHSACITYACLCARVDERNGDATKSIFKLIL